jgi:hypothetical protein
MALYHTNVLDPQIKALPTIGTAQGSVASFDTDMTENLISCVCDFSAQGGGGTPSAPVAIVGVDKVNVTRCGKNLFNKTATDTTKGYITGFYLLSNGNTNQGSAWNVSEYIKVTPNDKFAVSGISGNSPAICFYNSNKEYISGTAYNGSSSVAVTTPNNCFYVRISYNDSTIDTVQFEHGSTATNYEPYTGTTATCNLGDTYYGGSVDVVTGKITLTHEHIKISGLSWIYQSEQTRFYTNSLANYIKRPTTIYDVPDGLMCECYTADNYNNYVNNEFAVALSGNIFLKDSSYTDTITWLADVGNYYIVYPLATPLEIDVSSVVIPTISGTNNLFADTGDISAKYILSVGEALRQG